MEFIATFDSFLENKLYKNKEKLSEQDDNQYFDEPPGEWNYPNETEPDDEDRSIKEEFLEDLKKKIINYSIYGHYAGFFLSDLNHRMGYKITYKQWEAIILYLEKNVFDYPTPRKMAEAMEEIETKILADKTPKMGM